MSPKILERFEAAFGAVNKLLECAKERLAAS
jgi:hypothetical protein